MTRSKSLTLSRNNTRKEKRTTLSRIKSFIRWCFVLLFLAVLVAICVVYRRGADQLRDVASVYLQAQFPSVKTSFDSIALDATRGLRISGVKWSQKGASSEDSKVLLSAEELYVDCPVELHSLLTNAVQPRKIVVRRPCFYASSDYQKTKQEIGLLSPKVSNSSSCEIEIIDATLALCDPNGQVDKKIAGIRLQLLPDVSNAQSPQTDEPKVSTPEAPPVPPQEEERLVKTDASRSFEPRVRIGRAKTRTAEYTAYNSQVQIRPINAEEPKCQADVPSESSESHALDAASWTIEIEISNPYVESLRLSGRVDSQKWSVAGGVCKLDLSAIHDLLDELITLPSSFCNSVQGKTSFDVEASGDFKEQTPTFRIEGTVLNCSVTTPSLKYPLTEIESRYLATNNTIVVDKFAAHCGTTSIVGAYRQKGPLLSPETSTLKTRLDYFPLDDVLLNNLIKDAVQSGAFSKEQALLLTNFLEDYQFKATTNVEAIVEKKPQTNNEWKPTKIEISGQNVEFVYKDFPYRLDQLTGKIAIDAEETMTLELHSDANAPEIDITGRFFNVLSKPRGQVDVVANDRAIDAKLLAALPEFSRPTLQELHPSGRMDSRLRIVYDPLKSPEAPFHIETALDVRDGYVRYDLFPMPISSITGKIYMRDGAWVFNDLAGKIGAGAIVASGSLVDGKQLDEFTKEFRQIHLTAENEGGGVEFADEPLDASHYLSPAPLSTFASIPTPSNGPLAPESWRFRLTADVNAFPLGEELRNALVKYERKEDFEKLNLEGKGNGQIRVSYRTDLEKVAVEFDMKPIPGTTSLRPEKFPCELHNVDGRFVYREGTFKAEGFRAQNGRTSISADVVSKTIPDRGWTVDVANLRIDQLQIDRDLQSATPNQGLALLAFLNLTGSFNVDGAIRVSKGVGQQAKANAGWDLRIVAQQNSARPGVQLDAICGSVKLVGSAVEDGQALVYGAVNLDSLYYDDLQLTEVNGPFYYNGSDLFWGREAPTIRRTSLYQDPFLRSRIDLDPAFQTPLSPQGQNASVRIRRAPVNVARSKTNVRGQVQNEAPGFEAPEPAQDQPASLNVTADGRTPLQARLFDGIVVSDGVFNGGPTPTYRFSAALNNGNLEDVSRYFAPGSKPLKGKVDVHTSLQGEGRSVASLKGEGNMDVKEAELYELPQIVKIFQILSVQDPDQTAFDSANMKFQVLGDRLKVSDLLLKGDALTLFGEGWITLRGQEKLVDLTLNSRLGNASTKIPIVSDVLGEVGDQLTQIRVEGNLKTPIVHQEAAPGVKKAIWNVFPEREPEAVDKTPVERSRPIRDAWKKLTGKKE